MNRVDVNIRNSLILIRNIVQNEKNSLEQPVEADKILNLAAKHNVLPLVLEALYDVPEFDASSISESYSRRAMALVTAQAKRTVNFLSLYGEFEKRGIYPLVLKGLVCRSLYGQWCDHRPSSDEDILIRKSEFGASRKILEDAGYVCEIGDVTSSMVDELQEITFKNEKTKLTVELHLNPMGHDNDLRGTMNGFFENVWDNRIEMSVDGTKIYTMGHTNHFLFLVFHALRHFTAGGFGVRQMLDVLMYASKFKNDIDMEYIREALKKTNAVYFFEDMLYIGNTYLGFNLKLSGEVRCPEEMLEDVFSSGVFGNATQVQRTATPMISAAVSGKKQRVLSSVFPSKRRLVDKFPELNQKPWLLPFIWVKRMCTFLKHDKSMGGSLAKDSVAHGNKRIALLKKYGII